MGKSIRSKKNKALRTIRRERLQPMLEKQAESIQRALEAAAAAPPVPRDLKKKEPGGDEAMADAGDDGQAGRRRRATRPAAPESMDVEKRPAGLGVTAGGVGGKKGRGKAAPPGTVSLARQVLSAFAASRRGAKAKHRSHARKEKKGGAERAASARGKFDPV